MESNFEELAQVELPSAVMEVSKTVAEITDGERATKESTSSGNEQLDAEKPAEFNSNTVTRPCKRTVEFLGPIRVSTPILPKHPIDQSSAATILDSEITQQISLKSENKPPHRTRHRTVTVQSQLNNEIVAAFNEAKQVNPINPLGEAEQRVFAVVSGKEKEWLMKVEQASQMLAHEQKRNENLEQKAAERLLIIKENEKLIRELAEELKGIYKLGRRTALTKDGISHIGSDQSYQDISLVTKERDHYLEEVNSLEQSYSDLFHRYEKLRQMNIDLKKYGDDKTKECDDVLKQCGTMAEKYNILKEHAEEQLNLANEEIDRLIKQHDADTLALRMKVKQLEAKNETLAQKELDQMTVLFEEVISRAEAVTDVEDGGE